MSILTTLIKRFVAPSLPSAPAAYEQGYLDKLNNILRLYFNQIDQLLEQVVASSSNSVTINGFSGGTIDAFGRLRVSQPYTLFDSQSKYIADAAFDTSLTSGGTSTFNANQASVSLAVTTTSGSRAVRQTFRYFPYQPGKSLLILTTFAMNVGKTNLSQRVGFFDDQNGIYFSQDGTTLNFTVRSYTSGAAVNTTIPQASWNVDKLDGTGASGLTLDVTKTQIFFTDIEWLGVGTVRCGFVIGGVYVICHAFDNANTVNTAVYMTTAILPVRYEIVNTGVTATASTLLQICSSVMSEGGYDQVSQDFWVRNPSVSVPVTNVFVPICSIRLNSSRLGSVIIPSQLQMLPLTSANYEVVLIKNAALTSPSWVSGTFADVDYDITATALTTQPTATQICQVDFVSATSQSKQAADATAGYKWDLQLGVSLAGVSDTYTLGVRTIDASGSANTVIGAFSFYDLTV